LLITQRERQHHQSQRRDDQASPVDPRIEHPARDYLGRWRLPITLTALAESTVPERSPRILLVDDEQSIQTLLSYPLRKEGYDVVQATDGRQALERFEEQPFDLVVLDLMLPRIDGLEVCRRLRSRSSVPIIMLTAKSEEIDKVVGLELGADDYITKPFSLREFSSRIKAALRRAEMSRLEETMPGDTPLEIRELRIDFPKRIVRVRGEDAQLTYVEFEILSALARAPGRVFTRDMLLARVWGDSAYRDVRTIDVHIRHLREKIERDPKDPEYLFTVRGVGYRFRDTEP
jgi:DNA-binding response OmpR family regulator